MIMPLTADDVVSGIFHIIKKHKKEQNKEAILPADREKLHRAFYTVKVKDPDLMALLTFREREQFPESSQLDQALSNLDAAGLIARYNMTPRYYLLKDVLDRSYERYSKKLLIKAGFNETRIERIATEIEKVMDAA